MAEYTESWQKLEEGIGARPVLGGSVEEMRVAFAGLIGMLATQYPPLTGDVVVEDGSLDGPTYRAYRPRNLPPNAAVAVYYHGGGLALGDLDSEDRLCRTLAAGAGIVLVSIGYRLAPEHKAPTQVDDALKGLEWVESHAAKLTGNSSASVLVIGVSAGGGLALSTVRRVVLGKSSVPASRLSGLVLLSPVSLHPDSVPASLAGQYTAYTELPTNTGVVDTASMHTFFSASGADKADPDAFPGLDISSTAARFPPTYVAVAANDPIRDDGNIVVSALNAAGVSVQHKIYKGLPHCFWIFPTLPETKTFEQDTVTAIKSLVGRE